MARAGACSICAGIAMLATVAACGGGDGGGGADLPAEAAPDVVSEVVTDDPGDLPADVPSEASPDPASDPVSDAAADPAGDASPDPAPDAAPDLAADLPAGDAAPDLPWLPAAPGGFRRTGDAIVDDAGRTVFLHGVNVSNAAKYLPGNQAWHAAQDFATLAAAGIDSVRLLAFWSAVMPQEGVIDTAYLDEYARRVQWAADAGLLVVIDMHQDLFGVGFHEDGAPLWACDAANYDAYVPTQPWYLNYLSPQVRACFDRFYTDDALFARFVEAWVAIADRFRDHPAVVGFDLLNEPNPGTFEASRFVSDLWQPRQEQVAAALSAVAPDRLAFFQGATMLAYGVVDPFVPGPAPRVAFAPHYYLPSLHDGGEYDHDTMADMVDVAFDAVAQSAANLGGVPVWMGEWGGPTTVAGFDTYLEDILSRFASRRWSHAIYSDDAGGFGIRLPDLSIAPHLACRLGHPHLRRVPGPVASQDLAFDPSGVQAFTAVFEWKSPSAPLVAWTGPAIPGATTACTLDPPGDTPPRPCADFPCTGFPSPAPGLLEACASPGAPPGPWVLSLRWTPETP